MTNSFSIDNFCKFKNHLKELESLVTSQEDHLNKYFTELKNEINKAFVQQNHVINSDHDKKSELFCNWLQMTTSVNMFQQECKSNISTESNLATIGFTKQKLSELNQKYSLDTVDTLCHDINNIIQSEKIKIEKSLFKNKSIIFFNKFKSRDNILFNNNMQNLMDPDTTVGKLIIVNDEYFSKDDLVFLKK